MTTPPPVASSPARTLDHPVGRVGSWSRVLRVWLGGLLAVWLGPLTVAEAASMIPLDLAQLTDRAELILVGEVFAQQSRETDRGLIVTDVEISPLTVVKGSAPLHTPLLVTHLGGVVGEIGLHVPGEVTFTPGEEAVLFLRRDLAGALRVVGMSQGKLPVVTEDGTRWVQASPATSHLVHRSAPTLRQGGVERSKADVDGESQASDGNVRPRSEGRRLLAEFIRDVQQLVRP